MSGCAGIGLSRAARDEEDCYERQGGVTRHEDEKRTVAAEHIKNSAVERIAYRPAERVAEEVERRENSSTPRAWRSCRTARTS